MFVFSHVLQGKEDNIYLIAYTNSKRCELLCFSVNFNPELKLLIMTDWAQDLNQFLGDKGIKQSSPEFNQSEEKEIQKFLDETFKPSLVKIKKQLQLYPHINADIEISKKEADFLMEQVEFRVYKTLQRKFTYRLQFSKAGNGINVKGQFSFFNLYDENISFTDASLNKPIAGITENDVAEDFTKTFKEHFGK
ncbi:MAG: hypothetical protein M3Z01_03550 [Thermoproteota archaeon]|nr:hypothetical protein [Thermoproteota archaeon]